MTLNFQRTDFDLKKENSKFIMPPTLKKVGGHIASGLSVHSFVHLFVTLFGA